MRKTQKDGFWHRFFRSKIVFIVELCLVLVFSVAVVKEVVRRWEIRREIDRLETEIAAAKQSSNELSGLIAYFQSDYYKEREARLKLGLQKEGEKAVTIPGLGTGSQLDEVVAAIADKPEGDLAVSLPSKWWKYFFNK